MSGPSPALRRILLRSILAINLLAVLLLAVPLGLAIAQTYRAEAEAGLEREAARTLALTAESSLARIPGPLDPDVTVGIYDASGTLIAGEGPAADEDAIGALGDGLTRVKTEAGMLAGYVPFRREGGDPVTIRAVTPLSTLQQRTLRAWAALAGLVVISVALAAAVGLRRARQLAEPFERLASAAHDLREGGFALAIPSTGVLEGDEVARALEAAARSAAERVERAHSLAEDAGHQVRTPIAAASLALESALTIPGADLDQAARAALAQLDRASDSLAEVLDLRRAPDADAPTGPALPTVREAVARWRGVLASTGRACRLDDSAAPADAVVAETVLRQVLDILLDNSLKHGAGTTRVTVREAGAWVLVDVADAGRITGDSAALFTRGHGAGTGLGLALAETLAQSVGGELVLASAEPTRFTLALPTQEDT